MKYLKNKIAIVMACAGFVLTFFFTVGKIIEPFILLIRYVINILIFYLLGVAIPWIWDKFVLPIVENPVNENITTEKKVDLTETVEQNYNDASVLKPEDVTETVNQNQNVEGVTEEVTQNDTESIKKSYSPSKDFEIQDEFIIIKDKKLPNDPKLMAQAIKTKLSE